MNKQISIIGILFLAIIAIGTSTLFNACKKNDTTTPTTNCDRTCYFGTWKSAANVESATIVASSTDPSGIIIQNFFQGGDVTASVNGSSFTIPQQSTTPSYSYSGNGTLSDDEKTISITYKFNGIELVDTWTKL